VYDTPPSLLREIPGMIKKIIEGQKETTLDRVHFLTYGEYSLKYEIVFFVENSDYNRYADIQQEINFQIYDAFQAKGIQFAYPSQTIFMAKDIPTES
jgi:small-conductance mechanosensitive channel